MNKNGTVTADEARRAIAAEREERNRLCLEEIKKVLNQFNCRLEPVTVIRNNQVMQSLEIVAND